LSGGCKVKQAEKTLSDKSSMVKVDIVFIIKNGVIAIL
jgi:hypothetical protein